MNSNDENAPESLPSSPAGPREHLRSLGHKSPGQTDQSECAFVAVSRFTVANGMTAQVKQAFRGRPHRVEAVDGFVRLDVISPVESPDEIWLITYWRDESSYRSWHKSHAYQDSHEGIPRGLRLDPERTEIRFFEHVCS